ncbi:MAG: glycosyltransferase [Nodosilinea sp.]
MVDVAIFLMDLSGGGAEKVMLSLAHGFTDAGMTVDLVLVKAEGPYLSQISAQINTINLNKSRLILSLFPLANYLKKVNPSVLISALEDTNLVSLWAKKIAGTATQTIVTVHNNLTCEARNSEKFKRKLIPYLVSFFYYWADNIVGVSSGVAKDLMKLGLPENKICYIYNPIVNSDLRKKLQEPLEHPWLSLNEPPVILSVGRLTKQKDFTTLIQAFSLVRKQKTTRLIILGEGEEKPLLESLVEELGLTKDVAFLGFVSNPYVFMAKASVLVLSSAWEGFGNVLVESMASGTPVVSTNCDSGPAEILDDGKYGKLVSVGKAEDMANAILETLLNPLEANTLKKRANEFTLEKAVQSYQLLMQDVLI